MKKLVIKTICITLASLIGAMIIAASATMLFAPAWVGRQFDGAGNYSASVFFYEKQYQKTGNVYDLNTLVLKLDIKNDSVRAEKYYSEILRHKDFSKIVDGWKVSTTISANDYYNGNYVLVLAENGKFLNALSYAVNCVGSEYLKNNPMQVLIYSYLTADMTQEKQAVIEALDNLSVQNSLVLADKTHVENLI
ncbi:MAG: hypothetical protein IJA88_00410 [Clostridia bacterium]|nr:hypothetical protein [Clostridia bacterium]